MFRGWLVRYHARVNALAARGLPSFALCVFLQLSVASLADGTQAGVGGLQALMRKHMCWGHWVRAVGGRLPLPDAHTLTTVGDVVHDALAASAGAAAAEPASLAKMGEVPVCGWRGSVCIPGAQLGSIDPADVVSVTAMREKWLANCVIPAPVIVSHVPSYFSHEDVVRTPYCRLFVSCCACAHFLCLYLCVSHSIYVC